MEETEVQRQSGRDDTQGPENEQGSRTEMLAEEAKDVADQVSDVMDERREILEDRPQWVQKTTKWIMSGALMMLIPLPFFLGGKDIGAAQALMLYLLIETPLILTAISRVIDAPKEIPTRVAIGLITGSTAIATIAKIVAPVSANSVYVLTLLWGMIYVSLLIGMSLKEWVQPFMSAIYYLRRQI